MTFIETINEVLIRLREETIGSDWSGNLNDASSSIVNDYQKMIGALVNDTVKNIEGYHDWSSNRTTVNITPLQNAISFSLYQGTWYHGQDTQILSVYNEDTGTVLKQVTKDFINKKTYPDTEEVGEPLYYYIKGVVSSTSKEPILSIGIYPKTPSTNTNLLVDIIASSNKITAADTTVLMPPQPVILGTWARAIAERGEDGGTQASVAAREARESLTHAVMIDNGNTEYENNWYVV